MTACVHCGDRGDPVEVVHEGNVVAAGNLCEPCLAAAIATGEELRRQFDQLIASGIPRDTANAIMIARIDGKVGSA